MTSYWAYLHAELACPEFSSGFQHLLTLNIPPEKKLIFPGDCCAIFSLKTINAFF